jgi:hypothetical protein
VNFLKILEKKLLMLMKLKIDKAQPIIKHSQNPANPEKNYKLKG